MRNLLAVFLLAGTSSAAIDNLRVVGTTPTQAVIAYTAPDTNACSFQVSQGNAIGNLVPDVDPTIFTGANQDNRPGSLSSGVYRIVVIGKRSSELATAGQYAGIRHYSRALQLNTVHTFQVTCDSGTATIPFQTATLYPGNTYPDPWFHDPSNPGDQPYPEELGTQSLWSFIDSLTGMYLQEVSTRGDVSRVWPYPPTNPIISAHNAGQPPCDTAGPWIHPCYAVAPQGWSVSPTPGNYASVGNSTAWMILPVDMNQSTYLGMWGGTSYDSGDVFNQVQVSLTGYVSSSNPAMQQIDVCLSLNAGASCATAILTMTLPQSSPGTVQKVGQADPTQFGIIPWLMDSNPRINRPEFQAHQGKVTVAGNALTWVSGDPFSTYWFTGGNSTIWLAATTQSDACNFSSYLPSPNATEYPLLSLVDGDHMTISGTPAAGTYYFCTHQSVVMIRRHAADSLSTAYVQAASVQVVNSGAGSETADGEYIACLNTMVSGGYFCNIGGLFWVNPTTGATSWFGTPQIPAKATGTDQWTGTGPCPNPVAAWDQTKSVPTWYCLMMDTNGKAVLIMAQYTGGVTPPAQPRQVGGQINGLTVTATDNYSVTYGGGQLVFTDITPSSLEQSITDQMAVFDPTFIPATFPNCPGPSGVVVQQGIALTTCMSQGQDTPGWYIAIDPGDGIPAHAGTPQGAHIFGATNSYSGPVLRWRGTHSIQDSGESPYFGFSANPYGQMINTTNAAIPASGVSCATYGGTAGNNCSLVQMNLYESSYEPYLQNPTAPFTGAPGELGPTLPGDTAAFGSKGGEVMTLVSKNYGGTQGLWVWQRGSNPTAIAGTSPATVFFIAGSVSQVKWIASTDPHGENPLVDKEATGGHGYAHAGSAAEAYSTGSMTCTNPFFSAYQTRLGNYPGLATAATTFVDANPTFGGACFGIALPNDTQQHPNPPGETAVPNEMLEAFDVRPQLGGSQAPPFTAVSGQLYLSTWGGVQDPDTLTNTNSSGLISKLNRKLVGTAAACGAHPLVDISGPGSLIDGTSANSYKYCVVRVNGECYSGSVLGQVYVNCPNVVVPSCSGNGIHGGSTMGMGSDICLFNAASTAQMAVQFHLGVNDAPSLQTRSLTSAIGRLRMTSGFANARLLPDNSWILFLADWLNLNGHDLWMGKMPAWQTDSVDRSKFIPLMVSVEPPVGAKINNAIVQFGYEEDGAPSALNCTSRNDVCIANAGSIGTPPFFYASENPAALACSTGCTIALPAIPQRVLYYRVVYRDASNNVLSIAPLQAIAAP
jgi:hypothetical protein